MKTCLVSTAVLAAIILAGVGAEPKLRNPYAGTWRWVFTMPDGTKAQPKLKLKDENGRLTGKTSFRAGTETPITNLVVKADGLAFDVVRERDGRVIVTHYSGRMNGDTIQGQIRSNWSGDEQSYPWEAQKFSGIEGTWKWTFDLGRYQSDYRIKFTQEGRRVTGKLVGGRREREIKGGRFVNETVSFRTESQRDGVTYTNYYHGKVDGDIIEGRIEYNVFGEPRTNEWSAYRLD